MARAGTRDNQRSRVYAWERACVDQLAHSSLYDAEFKTLDECAAYATPIWNAERGRVGRANILAPSIERPNRGQRSALAHHGDRFTNGKRTGGRITLPRWARSRWVILHELAHRLTPSDEAHGARFVGVLIGLIARHLDYDATQLMALADEMGVKYYVRSIGVVPVRGPVWHVERAVRLHGPMTEMDLACHLTLGEGVDITPPQVRGAALHLIKCGRARWLRKKLVLIGDAAPKPPEPPKPARLKRAGPVGVRKLAQDHDIDIESMGDGAWMVYPGAWLPDEQDPHEGDHWCSDWSEVRKMVGEYVAMWKELDAMKARICP